MSNITKSEMKIEGLQTLISQYKFIDLLKECGDAVDNPQYFCKQVEQLRGMREMFDAIFGDAPYTKVAAEAMLSEI